MSDEARSVELWLEVVGAVDYLSSTSRPGLTVWGALAEAVRCWVDCAHADSDLARETSLPWDDPDPLRSELERLLRTVGPVGTIDGRPLPDSLDGALCFWLEAMARRFNDDCSFRRS